ncbi:hypothetical protein ACFX1T_009768 [Malus domestica]
MDLSVFLFWEFGLRCGGGHSWFWEFGLKTLLANSKSSSSRKSEAYENIVRADFGWSSFCSGISSYCLATCTTTLVLQTRIIYSDERKSTPVPNKAIHQQLK